MDTNLTKGSHIRPLNYHRDLNIVADLIEDSFSLQRDVDGQAFLKQMRQAARLSNIFGFTSNWPEAVPMNPGGFVWDEGGKIIGNISIIPFSHLGKKIFLIANVAVLSAYRRKGIARALTHHAVKYLSGMGSSQIWLQVNQENQGAVDLYHQLGFEDQCCRSSWHYLPGNERNSNVVHHGQAILRKRKQRDWQLQKDWILLMYPEKIIWHFPVRLQDFAPDSFWDAERWFEILKLRHWVVCVDDVPVGFMTWQKTESFADTLWMAPDPTLDESKTISSMLHALPNRVGRDRPLAVDIPCGRDIEPLQSAGFSFVRSLIWMKLKEN